MREKDSVCVGETEAAREEQNERDNARLTNPQTFGEAIRKSETQEGREGGAGGGRKAERE